MENKTLSASPQSPSAPSRRHLIFRVARFLGGRILTIALTIFASVFITVLLTSQPSQRGLGPPVSPFEKSLESQIFLIVSSKVNSDTLAVVPLDENGYPDREKVNQLVREERQALTDQLREEAGLNLPFLPRNLLWTLKAITFDWGELGNRQGGWASTIVVKASALDVIVSYLPNTLLLIGTAYLLVFLIGIPLSLHLSRNYGGKLDRLFAVLSPVSAVPSWVIGILLLSLFAFQLRWLPFGGMYDSFSPPADPIERFLVILKHMILPVSAIVFSLLFQMVFMWRTFFVIYSEEDYVELARAKGLDSRTLERRYILRPTLPYIITGYVSSLVGFWQLSMIVEKIFSWPGLGNLYISEALPNFWGESMEPGELIIVVGIVVIFAYLLGISVFLLDFIYVIVDPRIRLMPQGDKSKIEGRLKTKRSNWRTRLQSWRRGEKPEQGESAQSPGKKRGFSLSRFLENLRDSLRGSRERRAIFIREFRKYPSAIFGLAVIIVLLAGSIYAVLFLPYQEYGEAYDQNRLTGFSLTPRTAMPSWVNLFNDLPLLSTLILSEDSSQVSTSRSTLENGWVEKTTVFTFDYSYKDVPSEIFLYLEPIYAAKVPFVSLEWTYPDGRTLQFRDKGVPADTSYDFNSGINPRQILKQNPKWKDWFVDTGLYPTPAFHLLFAEPDSSELIPQRGTYRLTIKSLLLEKDSDLQPKLVMLGQVYGFAGTDYARRDLMVPLFWGMPFALLIGLMGTLLTSIVVILLPAIGVWFGGWVDNLVQRLTEINMVLPSLPIVVLTNVLFGWNIWVVLGIMVVLNTFGAPIKTLRSAFLQAKEAPYIEAARSYGTGDFRIITHYLVPRILPVLIPQLISQVPSFIFLEATLGFFNIKSNYPSWGRIIYEALTRGSFYGSPFWVLEPIFLLLLTSLAFAMLGAALERILNPRMIDATSAQKSAAD